MVSNQIGSVVTHESIDRLTEIVKSTLEDFPRQKLQKLRDKSIANFGNSAPKIVKYLFEKIEEESLSSSDKKIKEEILEVKQELAELRKEIRNIQAVQ